MWPGGCWLSSKHSSFWNSHPLYAAIKYQKGVTFPIISTKQDNSGADCRVIHIQYERGAVKYGLHSGRVLEVAESVTAFQYWVAARWE
jgi:hypothetical protein